MRPRHRNDRVASQIVRDSSGREHMLLNFFVQGQPHNAAAAAAPGDQSVLGAALESAQASAAALADMSPDDVLAATGQYATDRWDAFKRLFRFLSGDDLAPSAHPPPPPATEPRREAPPSGWKQGLTGLFAGLRPSGADAGGVLPGAPEEGFTDGEVHADLVMVRAKPARAFSVSSALTRVHPRTTTGNLSFGSCGWTFLVRLRSCVFLFFLSFFSAFLPGRHVLTPLPDEIRFASSPPRTGVCHWRRTTEVANTRRRSRTKPYHSHPIFNIGSPCGAVCAAFASGQDVLSSENVLLRAISTHAAHSRVVRTRTPE